MADKYTFRPRIFSVTDTLDAAIEKPFDQYMEWCRDFVQRKAQQCPITSILLTYPYVWTGLEAGWAHRYWMHHASRIVKS